MVEIVYWSGTGNTEAMANEIEAAVKAAGADVESVRFEDTNVDDVASKDVILLGCPAMGSEELEDSVADGKRMNAENCAANDFSLSVE